MLNADLTFNGFTQVLGPDPGTPSCPGGVLTLTLTFPYNGANEYENLFYRIVALDAPRTVIGAGGVGSDLNIPNANLGPDMKLTLGEMLIADIPVCLPNQNMFTLLVDVFGSPVPPVKRVFVSSTRHKGNMAPTGGLAGGDAICQGLADNAALGGTWTAWLSTDSVDARDRISDHPYFLVDGVTQVATGVADLTDGVLNNSIEQTEFGAITMDKVVWTGTSSTGLAALSNCQNWTTSAPFGPIGAIGLANVASNGSWTNDRTEGCFFEQRLYCFED